MASRMLVIASSRVLPWETHPGKAGHSATNMLFSSGSMVTRNFIGTMITAKSAFRNVETRRRAPQAFSFEVEFLWDPAIKGGSLRLLTEWKPAQANRHILPAKMLKVLH